MGEQSKKWYVVKAISGKEKKAKEYIENEVAHSGLSEYVSQVLIPTEKVYSVRNGKRVSKDRTLFPGYVLIEASLEGEVVHIIKNVPNVIDFLSEKDGTPVPLQDFEVKRILGRVDEMMGDDEELLEPFIVGETVKIIDGPFNNFSGVIDEINNEKMYLKQAIDTASFFTTTRKMFLAYEALDSAEAGLLGNGNITTAKSRKKNATLLEKYRQNLYNGGLYFVRNAKYKDAFNSFDTYIDCMQQPLFSAHVASFDTTTMSTAAFWTLFCGYKINNPQMALKYADLALKNENYRSRSFQYLVEVYEQQKDLSHYLDALKQGFMENKTSRFFFTKLVDYYNDKNLLDSALQVVDYSLQEEPDNSLFLFAKSNILLNKGDYDGCISITDKLIARLDTVPELYYNAGISYLNKALLPETSNVVMDAKEIDQCLKMSMLYMEKYRAMRPEDRERWVTPLYNIYFKLNMGKQFEEMSNLLQKMRK